jgi:hypothetical protein
VVVSSESKGAPLRICVVKQTSCYDLYTLAGSDVGELAKSSNDRSGPLALWELPGAEVEFRIVEDSPDPECRAGQLQWGRFVEGWDYKRPEHPDPPDSVDWSSYDVVVSIDVAVPERIVRKHRGTLWCYYFIEGGPNGIDQMHAGSPQYSYNVFLNHRPAARLASPCSRQRARMAFARRAVLDFPYYLLSDESLTRIYASQPGERSGVCIASSSIDRLPNQLSATLEHYGELRRSYGTLAEFHAAMAASKYFVVLPGSPPKAGGALVDAISAGCVVLAPHESVISFRGLLHPELDFSDEGELLRHLDVLENDPMLWDRVRATQAEVVRLQFCRYPLRNLAQTLSSFRASRATSGAQRLSERLDFSLAPLLRFARRVRTRLVS